MDVKLVLGARWAGIDGENHAVMRRRLALRVEELAGAPCVLEIVGRVRGRKRSVLDAGNSSGRRQDETRGAERRPQNGIAARLSGRHVHFQAGEGAASQRMVEETDFDDPPERAAA